MTEKSDLVYGIANQEALKRRIESLVRMHWWNDPDADPQADIPTAGLMWAVASNPQVQATVTAAMDKHDDPIEAGNYGKAIADIPDSDIEFILFSEGSGAVERLKPPVLDK